MRGSNLLDSGCPFYDTYETADGRYVAVACLEPQFFAAFLDVLDIDRSWADHQYDTDRWQQLRELLTDIFKTRARDVWADRFAGTDACVTPVLTPDEAARHPHNVARGSFTDTGGHAMPGITPKFLPPKRDD